MLELADELSTCSGACEYYGQTEALGCEGCAVPAESRFECERFMLGDIAARLKRLAEKPEPSDSWERIEMDCGMFASEYAEKRGLEKYGGGWGVPMRRDLVRRCRELAGKDES